MPPAGQSFTAQGRAVIRTQSVLDGNGRLKQLIDDRGAATNYAYDTLNCQTKMIFVDGSVRTSGYNAASDVTSYTDENGSVFASTFDPIGRRTAVGITLATGVVGTTAQSFEYDGLSRLTFSRDSISSTHADALFFYDSLGRVVEESQVFDGTTRYITHDAFTSYPATDTTLPNDRQIAMRYDLLYRKDLVNETDGAALIAKWRFIGPGRTLELELGNGLVCTQLNNDRTHSAVQVGVSNPAWGNQSSDRLGYDGAGRMSTKRYLSDEVNDGTGVYANPASLVGFTTSFDPASNKTYERHLHAENRSHLYPDYDSADRLLEYERGTLASGGASISSPITLPGTNTLQSYDLDGLGNWKKTQFSPAGGSLTTQQRRHNYLNQITKFGATTVLYDHGNNAASGDPLIAQRGNGNLTDDGTLTLTYDALNRLKQAFRKSDNNQIAEYTYDALGRRIRKIVTHGGITGNSDLNGTTDFLLDGVQVVEERNVNDDEIKQYVWGYYVDELIQIKTYTDIGAEPLTAGNYYLLSDLLYRSVALTNDSGTIVEAYDTDAYGNTICYKAAGTASNWFAADAVTTDNPANTTIFTGREFDPETRLYYYRARYFEPTFGRFVGGDPAGYTQGLNLFCLADSNSLVNLDPYGLQAAPALPAALVNGTIYSSKTQGKSGGWLLRSLPGTATTTWGGPLNMVPTSFLLGTAFKLYYTPSPSNCDCTDIEIIQFVQMSIDGTVLLGKQIADTLNDAGKTFSDANGWIVDQTGKALSPFYNRNNGGFVDRNMPAGYSINVPLPLNIKLPVFSPTLIQDLPSDAASQKRTFTWNFIALAVCVSGSDAGTVYDAVTYGFTKFNGSTFGSSVTDPAGNPTATPVSTKNTNILSALVEWNKHKVNGGPVDAGPTKFK